MRANDLFHILSRTGPNAYVLNLPSDMNINRVFIVEVLSLLRTFEPPIAPTVAPLPIFQTLLPLPVLVPTLPGLLTPHPECIDVLEDQIILIHRGLP